MCQLTLNKRVTRSSAAQGRATTSTTRSTSQDISKPDFYLGKHGEGMTTWWLKVVILAVLGSYAPQYFNADLVAFLKGVATLSGLCVMIGYYTVMTGAFFLDQRHLYLQVHKSLQFSVPFPIYVALDLSVHVGVVVACFTAWNAHINTSTCTGAFVLHRMWSLHHSGYTAPWYLNVETVYGFVKPLPPMLLAAMYGSECVLCYLGSNGLLSV